MLNRYRVTTYAIKKSEIIFLMVYLVALCYTNLSRVRPFFIEFLQYYVFHDYLQKKLKYLSGITKKHIGAYFILYSIYTITHIYIIQYKKISPNSQIYLLFLEENCIMIRRNKVKMDTHLLFL